MIPSGSTSWLYADNPYVPEQFLYKEASETHLFMVWKMPEQTLVLKWQPQFFFCFNHHHQQNICSLSETVGMRSISERRSRLRTIMMKGATYWY